MDVESRIQDYIFRASPDKWYEYATELKDCSEQIWTLSNNSLLFTYDSDTNLSQTRPGVSRTYMLLIGICLENLLKGLIIAQNPDMIKDGKIDQSISVKHDLFDLSTKVSDIKFNDKEIALLKILSDAVPYWGKYPIPKKFEQLKQETLVSFDWRSTFLNLSTKLEKTIYDLIKFGWFGPNNVTMNEWFVSSLENLPVGYENMSFEELFKIRREISKKN